MIYTLVLPVPVQTTYGPVKSVACQSRNEGWTLTPSCAESGRLAPPLRTRFTLSIKSPLWTSPASDILTASESFSLMSEYTLSQKSQQQSLLVWTKWSLHLIFRKAQSLIVTLSSASWIISLTKKTRVFSGMKGLSLVLPNYSCTARQSATLKLFPHLKHRKIPSVWRSERAQSTQLVWQGHPECITPFMNVEFPLIRIFTSIKEQIIWKF